MLKQEKERAQAENFRILMKLISSFSLFFCKVKYKSAQFSN